MSQEFRLVGESVQSFGRVERNNLIGRFDCLNQAIREGLRQNIRIGCIEYHSGDDISLRKQYDDRTSAWHTSFVPDDCFTIGVRSEIPSKAIMRRVVVRVFCAWLDEAAHQQFAFLTQDWPRAVSRSA